MSLLRLNHRLAATPDELKTFWLAPKRVAKSPEILSNRSSRRYPPARARGFNLQPFLEIDLSSKKLDFMGISARLYRCESLL
jgi:hypothetical protein